MGWSRKSFQQAAQMSCRPVSVVNSETLPLRENAEAKPLMIESSSPGYAMATPKVALNKASTMVPRTPKEPMTTSVSSMATMKPTMDDRLLVRKSAATKASIMNECTQRMAERLVKRYCAMAMMAPSPMIGPKALAAPVTPRKRNVPGSVRSFACMGEMASTMKDRMQIITDAQ
jgi:hypothetical protein